MKLLAQACTEPMLASAGVPVASLEQPSTKQHCTRFMAGPAKWHLHCAHHVQPRLQPQPPRQHGV